VPVEIENALRQHPKVAEACVVPVPHAEDGNLIRAVVELKAGAVGGDELAAELREFLKDKVQRNKVPHLVKVVDALPKSAIGKVLRREVLADGADA
jgi:long-chain acyl-CoA synthetase